MRLQTDKVTNRRLAFTTLSISTRDHNVDDRRLGNRICSVRCSSVVHVLLIRVNVRLLDSSYSLRNSGQISMTFHPQPEHLEPRVELQTRSSEQVLGDKVACTADTGVLKSSVNVTVPR
jgi:hypothetical protein